MRLLSLYESGGERCFTKIQLPEASVRTWQRAAG